MVEIIPSLATFRRHDSFVSSPVRSSPASLPPDRRPIWRHRTKCVKDSRSTLLRSRVSIRLPPAITSLAWKNVCTKRSVSTPPRRSAGYASPVEDRPPRLRRRFVDFPRDQAETLFIRAARVPAKSALYFGSSGRVMSSARERLFKLCPPVGWLLARLQSRTRGSPENIELTFVKHILLLRVGQALPSHCCC